MLYGDVRLLLITLRTDAAGQPGLTTTFNDIDGDQGGLLPASQPPLHTLYPPDPPCRPAGALPGCLGLSMLFSTVRFVAHGWVVDLYIAPELHCPYYGVRLGCAALGCAWTVLPFVSTILNYRRDRARPLHACLHPRLL